MRISSKSILGERLERQCLTEPLKTPSQYLALFRLLQPVSTIFFTRPGDPPSLRPRSRFNDAREADKLRSTRTIIKGRFLGNGIGYVLAEDLWMYANTFRRPVKQFSDTQQTVLRTLETTGPLAPRQIKEETGLLNKEIMPALHRLQKAFVVYEDQIDTDWERAWYYFPSEWPEISLSEDGFQLAASGVLLRFLEGHVFATFEQIKDWSQLPGRALTKVLQEMENAGLIVQDSVKELGQGWMRSADCDLAEADIQPSVFMLHKADYLVRSHISELKRRFGGEEVLQYLLIDGEFQGAVLGHWRIGPHDVSDIVVELPRTEIKNLREKILAVVGEYYHPPSSHILKYAGKTLSKSV